MARSHAEYRSEVILNRPRGGLGSFAETRADRAENDPAFEGLGRAGVSTGDG